MSIDAEDLKTIEQIEMDYSLVMSEIQYSKSSTTCFNDNL
jgi:hypothetical protein